MYVSKGFILVTTLILMMILSMITLPMLVQTQLSQKMVASSIQHAQLKQLTLSQHLFDIKQLKTGAVQSGAFSIAACPALYAAWSDIKFQCKWHEVQTSKRVAEQRLSMTSILVRQSLPEGGSDEGY